MGFNKKDVFEAFDKSDFDKSSFNKKSFDNKSWIPTEG